MPLQTSRARFMPLKPCERDPCRFKPASEIHAAVEISAACISLASKGGSGRRIHFIIGLGLQKGEIVTTIESRAISVHVVAKLVRRACLREFMKRLTKRRSTDMKEIACKNIIGLYVCIGR